MTDPSDDDDGVKWYTYTLWFWGGMLLLWLARSCSTGESTLYRAFEEMGR